MSQEFADVRKRAVEIAMEEVAKKVRENLGPNQGTEINKYFKWTYALPDSEMDWCGMFVNYCFRRAADDFGKVLPWWNSDKTIFWKGSSVKQWVSTRPNMWVNEYPVCPGDIYVMTKGHIGIVKETTNEGSLIIHTIDGNQSTFTAGRISLKTNTRNLADVSVIIRI